MPAEASQDGPNDLTVRPATLDDSAQIARLYRSVRLAASPLIPPPVHTVEEDLEFFAGILAGAQHEGWLAEVAAELVGFAIVTQTWLDHLYVRPDHQGVGVGGVLLELVKALRPDGFGLWVFETNTPARAFYARHGLIEVERTDGSENEERAPDIRMVWPVGAL